MITLHANFINTRHPFHEGKYSPANPHRWDYSSCHYSSRFREGKYSSYISGISLLVNCLPLKGGLLNEE